MSTLTSGHLADNGGLRGHSAGDIFPWRIMSQGTFADMTHWVISPQGNKMGQGFKTVSAAMRSARALKGFA